MTIHELKDKLVKLKMQDRFTRETELNPLFGGGYTSIVKSNHFGKGYYLLDLTADPNRPGILSPKDLLRDLELEDSKGVAAETTDVAFYAPSMGIYPVLDIRRTQKDAWVDGVDSCDFIDIICADEPVAGDLTEGKGRSRSMRARRGLNKIQEMNDEQYAEYNKWFEPEGFERIPGDPKTSKGVSINGLRKDIYSLVKNKGFGEEDFLRVMPQFVMGNKHWTSYFPWFANMVEREDDEAYEVFEDTLAELGIDCQIVKPMVRESKRKYNSVMRHIRSIKESSQWNRETNPYAKAAFDAVFNLIDSSYIDLDQAEDDMMEEEYRAENNEMFQMVLQGIYHALEQFIPQVNEIFGPDGLNIIFGDELYDLSI